MFRSSSSFFVSSQCFRESTVYRKRTVGTKSLQNSPLFRFRPPPTQYRPRKIPGKRSRKAAIPRRGRGERGDSLSLSGSCFPEWPKKEEEEEDIHLALIPTWKKGKGGKQAAEQLFQKVPGQQESLPLFLPTSLPWLAGTSAVPQKKGERDKIYGR